MRIHVLLAITTAFFLVSCAPQPTEPQQSVASQVLPIVTKKIINEPYDKAWGSLVAHIGATSFAIGHVEKDSGLLTLDFSTPDLSKFATAGKSGNGDKIDELKGSIIGSMNIVVTKVSENETSISIKAGYHLSSNVLGDAHFLPIDFDSGSCSVLTEEKKLDLFGVKVPLTTNYEVCPNGKAESAILDAL